jgi:hypothetical protein
MAAVRRAEFAVLAAHDDDGVEERAGPSIFCARRFAWVGERSRWNGVGCTAESGREATSTVLPDSGSRYAPIGAPPRSRTWAASPATRSSSTASAMSAASRPRWDLPGASDLPRDFALRAAGRAAGFLRAGLTGRV